MLQLFLQVFGLINSFFSSETPLQYKLINTTIASIAYNKAVIIARFLDGT